MSHWGQGWALTQQFGHVGVPSDRFCITSMAQLLRSYSHWPQGFVSCVHLVKWTFSNLSACFLSPPHLSSVHHHPSGLLEDPQTCPLSSVHSPEGPHASFPHGNIYPADFLTAFRSLPEYRLPSAASPTLCSVWFTWHSLTCFSFLQSTLQPLKVRHLFIVWLPVLVSTLHGSRGFVFLPSVFPSPGRVPGL